MGRKRAAFVRVLLFAPLLSHAIPAVAAPGGQTGNPTHFIVPPPIALSPTSGRDLGGRGTVDPRQGPVVGGGSRTLVVVPGIPGGSRVDRIDQALFDIAVPDRSARPKGGAAQVGAPLPFLPPAKREDGPPAALLLAPGMVPPADRARVENDTIILSSSSVASQSSAKGKPVDPGPPAGSDALALLPC